MNFNPRLRTRFCMSDSLVEDKINYGVVTLLATFAKSFVIGIVVILYLGWLLLIVNQKDDGPTFRQVVSLGNGGIVGPFSRLGFP